jgi:phosphoribosylaminoimidazolecarboxamide formyltransferase/IMP cyclohydrolase
MEDKMQIKRALVSVSDKKGLIELVSRLDQMGVEILSTGGTLKKIREAGIQAVGVSAFTGSPEVMGGRVKTLHPKIHAGILHRRDNPTDVEELTALDSKAIDLVIVNLYPFRETIARPEVTRDEAVENIDIGGPSMLRAAAKNYHFVTIVVEPSEYAKLLDEMEKHDGATTMAFREQCAAKAFALTAAYDTAIAEYFAAENTAEVPSKAQFPPTFNIALERKTELRYGENPHQPASLYSDNQYRHATLLRAEILSGKELSYNNYYDLDAALGMILDFAEPFACVLKHTNPCGAAVGESVAEAYQAAYESDPLSAFGSIIGLNRVVDMATADLLRDTPFIECILAPGYETEALKLLKRKKARRILAVPQVEEGLPEGQVTFRYIRGGFLVQTEDTRETAESELKVVTRRAPTPEEIRSLLFAWKVVKHTKSNAIVLARGTATVGVGMGQTSRVDSGFMAVKRAGDRARGAVMASDAFFPMPDGVEVGTDAGVTAIIQPGGSKGDEDAIAAADKAGAAMVFTGIRHFKH